MPERSQQLLDDDYDLGTDTQNTEGKSRRRADVIPGASGTQGSPAPKRKRKIPEKEREREYLRSAPANKVSF